MKSMDSILADEPSVHTMPENRQEAVTQESPAAGAVQSEQQAATDPTKSTTEVAPATGEDDDEPQGPEPVDSEGYRRALAAARGDARRWRKSDRERQRQLDQLHGQMQALQHQVQAPRPQQQAPQETKPQPGFLDDPEGFTRRVATEGQGEISKRLDTIESGFRKARINDAAARLVEANKDGAENLAYFDRLCAFKGPDGQVTPESRALIAQFEAVVDGKHPTYRDPAKFANDYAKAAKRLQGVGSLDDYESRIRTEEREKVIAELNGGGADPKRPQQRPQPSKSLANLRGGGGAAKQAWSGPRSMKEIVG